MSTKNASLKSPDLANGPAWKTGASTPLPTASNVTTGLESHQLRKNIRMWVCIGLLNPRWHPSNFFTFTWAQLLLNHVCEK